MLRLLLSISFGVILLGCAKTPPPQQAGPAGKLPRAYLKSEFARDRARFAAAATKSDRKIDVLAYRLKGHFDWEKRTLFAVVDVRVKLLDPALHDVVLDSRVTVHDVTIDERKVPYSAADSLLTIHVAEPHEEMTFTIAYEARANVGPDGEESSLVASHSRKGDPISARTVATLSEPLGASEWMPCNNVPSDRAFFSAELSMPSEQSLISNGDLVHNKVTGGKRVMHYSTRYTIPTYLMAFAVGDFESTTVMHAGKAGKLPVSVWRRKGLPIDDARLLGELGSYIDIFENLLVPYPFEKYSLVLLPEYTGGIEHAGITFQGETSSSQPLMEHDRSLTAHELGHQWFGDLMTIDSWDDLWIKEGMATLLAEEASRRYEDQSHSGRLFGKSFTPKSGDAIADPSLAPDAKYTSGPYDRAAWLYTQLRAVLGEEKFWGILRENLRAHAFGSVATNEFIESFHSALSAQQFDSLKLAVKAKALPKLSLGGAADGRLSLSLADADTALLVPLELRWYRADGTSQTTHLAHGTVASLEMPEGGLLTLDPQDRHPVSVFEVEPDAFEKHVFPLTVPQTDAGRALFLRLAPHHQIEALSEAAPWKLPAIEFSGFFDGLSSEEARFRSLQVACEIAARPDTTPAERAMWKTVLSKKLANGSPLLVPGHRGKGLSQCRETVGEELFAPEWKLIEENPRALAEPRLHYLINVSTSAPTAYRVGRSLAEGGASVRARYIGVRLLNLHLLGRPKFEKPAAADLPAWNALFRGMLETVEPSEILKLVLETIHETKDKAAIPSLAVAVKMAQHPPLQKTEVCAAVELAGTDTEAWKSFVSAVGDTSGLSPKTAELIADPKKCSKEDAGD